MHELVNDRQGSVESTHNQRSPADGTLWAHGSRGRRPYLHVWRVGLAVALVVRVWHSRLVCLFVCGVQLWKWRVLGRLVCAGHRYVPHPARATLSLLSASHVACVLSSSLLASSATVRTHTAREGFTFVQHARRFPGGFWWQRRRRFVQRCVGLRPRYVSHLDMWRVCLCEPHALHHGVCSHGCLERADGGGHTPHSSLHPQRSRVWLAHVRVWWCDGCR